MEEVTLIEKNINSGWNTQAIKTCFVVTGITLVDCVSYNSVECVKWLINNGYDVHAENDYALRYASEEGHIGVVKVLLNNGYDVHAHVQNDGAAPHEAAHQPCRQSLEPLAPECARRARRIPSPPRVPPPQICPPRQSCFQRQEGRRQSGRGEWQR